MADAEDRRDGPSQRTSMKTRIQTSTGESCCSSVPPVSTHIHENKDSNYSSPCLDVPSQRSQRTSMKTRIQTRLTIPFAVEGRWSQRTSMKTRIQTSTGVIDVNAIEMSQRTSMKTRIQTVPRGGLNAHP